MEKQISQYDPRKGRPIEYKKENYREAKKCQYNNE